VYSTYQFDRAMGYGFFDPIPEVLVYVALAAWVLAMAGLLRRIVQAGRAAGREQPV
jgi:hypothetical protein